MTRKTALALVTVVTIGVVAFVAHAMMGTPGGATRSVLTFAGTLTDTSGAPIKMPQTVEFDFTNPKNVVCQAAGLAVTPDPSTGAFTVDIPIDACPGGAAFFDGSDITYKITVGTTVVTSTPPPTISPVPYAKYADVAAGLTPQSAAAQAIATLQTARPAITVNGKVQQYLDATFVGSTTVNYDGNLAALVPAAPNGYVAANILCQKEAFATPTTHICTPTEMLRWSEVNRVPFGKAPYAWIAAGVTDPTNTATDCQGFTDNSQSHKGTIWHDAVEPSTEVCSSSVIPIACCD